MKRLLLILSLLLPFRALSEIPIIEGDDIQWSFAGYVRAMMAAQHIPYDTRGLIPDSTAINASVGRLQWKLSLYDKVTIDLQQRLYWQLTSAPLQSGGGLGIGATRTATSTLDLNSNLMESDTHLLSHNIDRLSVQFFLDALDLTVGRQSITWGRSNIFLVSDIWTQFSPFELDTSQKPGIDALRALTSWSDGTWELEGLVVDRGDAENISGGVRLNTYQTWGDVSVAVAWDRQRLLWLGDLSLSFDEAVARLDASWVSLSLDAESAIQAPKLPRVTAGIDYLGLQDWFFSAEYHFNGFGTDDASGYIDEASSEEVARGEVYWLGQHYGGLMASWTATELLNLSLAVISNLQDPSANLVPSILYQLSDASEVSLGAYIGLGKYPSLFNAQGFPDPKLRSEFGNQGSMIFVQMASYF